MEVRKGKNGWGEKEREEKGEMQKKIMRVASSFIGE